MEEGETSPGGSAYWGRASDSYLDGDMRLACGPDCYLPNPFWLPGVSDEFNRAYQHYTMLGRGAAAAGVPVMASDFAANILAWFLGPARGAAPATLQQIGQGRSIQAAVQALNQAGATQAQAVQVLNQVVGNSSRSLVQATLQGQPGSVVLSGVQFVPGGLTKVVVITSEGVAAYGSAVTNLVNGTLVVSNFIAN